MVIFTHLGWQSQWYGVRAGLRNSKNLSRKGALKSPYFCLRQKRGNPATGHGDGHTEDCTQGLCEVLVFPTHVSIGRFISVTLPHRSVGARHRERVADVVALHEAVVGLRVRIVARITTVTEVVYSSAQHTP